MTLPNDSASLRELIDELLEAWDKHGRPNELTQPKARRGQKIKSSDVARMECVMGLSRHVHETAKSIKLLLDNNHFHSAIPLVRLAYECALTSVWLVQSEGDEGVKAFIHEYARGNKNLQDNLRQAMSATFRENADQIPDADVAPYAGSLDSTQRFDLLCKDLDPGGTDAYIYYRLLSAFSHPTMKVVDLYFDTDPNGGPIPGRLVSPRIPLPDDFLLFLTCASMVWSARPISYLSKDKTYRSLLRRAAQQIGVTSEIHLSKAYRERHAKAGKQRRVVQPE